MHTDVRAAAGRTPRGTAGSISARIGFAIGRTPGGTAGSFTAKKIDRLIGVSWHIPLDNSLLHDSGEPSVELLGVTVFGFFGDGAVLLRGKEFFRGLAQSIPVLLPLAQTKASVIKQLAYAEH